MSPRSLEVRLARITKRLKERSIYLRDCICFPKGVQPAFHFQVEMEIAATVKCPLHGERFKPFGLMYVSQWLRPKREKWLLTQSAQYRKAWYASFPRELWPAEEKYDQDGRRFLLLKDGTKLST